MLKTVSLTVRALSRQPIFTLSVVGTLALGIGATTAIFSTVNAALLRPFPYPRSTDLFSLGTTFTDGRVTTGKVAPVEIARLNDASLPVLKAAYAARFDGTLIGADGTPASVTTYGVGEGFFEVFALPMTLGRPFTREEHAVNGPPLAVLSYGTWRDLFGSDAGIVGRTVRLAEGPMTVVGVAARAFEMPHDADLWFNFRLDPRSTVHRYDGYLRVRPGTAAERLESGLAGVMAGLARDFPSEELNRAYVVRPLLDAILGDLRPMLLLVFGASALVLVLACVNVSNLLLARSVSRTREMAVRVALGAGRRNVIVHLLTESVVLASLGAALGVFLARSGVQALLVLGASRLPRLEAVAFDSSVLLFALGALLVSGIGVGLVPALRLAVTDVRTLLNDAGRSAAAGGRYQRRVFSAMIVAEVGVAITLVANAGLLARTFLELQRTDPGFAARGRLAVDVLLPAAQYTTPDHVAAWSRAVADDIRTIHGVTQVSAASSAPLDTERDTVWYVGRVGAVLDPARPDSARVRRVGPGFFEAMGIRLRAGREFTWADRQGATPVAIVNRLFAERYLSGGDPLKERVAVGYPTVNPRNALTVVGVADDVRYAALAQPPEPTFYLALPQAPFLRQTIVVATALQDPASIAASVQTAVRKANPEIPMSFRLVDDIVASSLNRQRLGVTLMTLFALVALALAATGIYGVIAYASSQRAGELATRLALGARPAAVFWMLIREGGTLALLGAVLGVVGAYGGGRLVAGRLQEVRPFDPAMLTSAVASVLAITFVSLLIPAWRGSRVDPGRTLRSE